MAWPTRTLPAALLLGLAAACGPPEIPLGQQFTGTLTALDDTWSESDGTRGYDTPYVVQVTAGQSYTVIWGTDNGFGNFEDDEGGTFTQGNLSLGNTIPDALATSPSTSTWVPAMTGLNKVDIDAQADHVPLKFTITITPQ